MLPHFESLHVILIDAMSSAHNIVLIDDGAAAIVDQAIGGLQLQGNLVRVGIWKRRPMRNTWEEKLLKIMKLNLLQYLKNGLWLSLDSLISQLFFIPAMLIQIMLEVAFDFMKRFRIL